MLYKVTNFLIVGEEDEEVFSTEKLIQYGIGSVLDLRLKYPDDYIKRERVDLSRAGIDYDLMPMDKECAGPLPLLMHAVREMRQTMGQGKRMLVYQNAGQNVAQTLAALYLMNAGLSPKQCHDMTMEAKATHDPAMKYGDKCSMDQKKMMDMYGAYLVQKPFFKDVNEEIQYMKHMMDTMEKDGQSPVVASKEDHLMGAYLWSKQLAGHEKKSDCGCGGK